MAIDQDMNVVEQLIDLIFGSKDEARAYAADPEGYVRAHGAADVDPQIVARGGVSYGTGGGGGGGAVAPAHSRAGVHGVVQQLHPIVYNHYYEDNDITNALNASGDIHFDANQSTGDFNQQAIDNATAAAFNAGADVDADAGVDADEDGLAVDPAVGVDPAADDGVTIAVANKAAAAAALDAADAAAAAALETAAETQAAKIAARLTAIAAHRDVVKAEAAATDAAEELDDAIADRDVLWEVGGGPVTAQGVVEFDPLGVFELAPPGVTPDEARAAEIRIQNAEAALEDATDAVADATRAAAAADAALPDAEAADAAADAEAAAAADTARVAGEALDAAGIAEANAVDAAAADAAADAVAAADLGLPIAGDTDAADDTTPPEDDGDP